MRHKNSVKATQELKTEKDSEIQKLQLEIDAMKQALCEMGRKEFC